MIKQILLKTRNKFLKPVVIQMNSLENKVNGMIELLLKNQINITAKERIDFFNDNDTSFICITDKYSDPDDCVTNGIRQSIGVFKELAELFAPPPPHMGLFWI
jgi:hypothetical protein